jgi:hypothetical protein
METDRARKQAEIRRAEALLATWPGWEELDVAGGDTLLRQRLPAGEPPGVVRYLRMLLGVEDYLPPLPPGTEVSLGGRVFAVERLLSEGGRAGTRLYLAREAGLERTVVLKTEFLPRDPDEKTKADLRKTADLRLRQEKLGHLMTEAAGVTPLYGVGEFTCGDSQFFAYAMRYEARAVPWRQASGEPLAVVQRCVRLAEELARIHRCGVIHGDLHPGNVLVDQERVLLIDLGLAYVLGQSEPHVAGGARPYAAPEIWDTRPPTEKPPLTPAADRYSFGVLLGETLLGERLPEKPAPDPGPLLAGIRALLPEKLRQADEGWLPLLAELLTRCLAPEPAERFSDWSDLRSPLEALARQWQDILEPAPARQFYRPPLVSGCFAGRDADLQRVGEILDQAGTTAWVHAEGGMGKSSLARHYVEAHLRDHPFYLWVDATNGTTLTSGYDRLARELNLPAQHLEKAPERVQAVRAWLARTPGWLLVLDNLDNPAVLKEPLEPLPHGVTTALPSPYLPDQHCGRVLITSRTDETGWLRLSSKSVHRLEKLGRQAAEDYILQTSERRREDLPPAEK